MSVSVPHREGPGGLSRKHVDGAGLVHRVVGLVAVGAAWPRCLRRARRPRSSGRRGSGATEPPNSSYASVFDALDVRQLRPAGAAAREEVDRARFLTPIHPFWLPLMPWAALSSFCAPSRQRVAVAAQGQAHAEPVVLPGVRRLDVRLLRPRCPGARENRHRAGTTGSAFWSRGATSDWALHDSRAEAVLVDRSHRQRIAVVAERDGHAPGIAAFGVPCLQVRLRASTSRPRARRRTRRPTRSRIASIGALTLCRIRPRRTRRLPSVLPLAFSATE